MESSPVEVIFEWSARTIRYRALSGDVFSLRFTDPTFRKATDHFLYCCAIGIAQDAHSTKGLPTRWTGADHSFLDRVVTANAWRLNSRSRDTYWSQLPG